MFRIDNDVKLDFKDVFVWLKRSILKSRFEVSNWIISRLYYVLLIYVLIFVMI